MKLLAIDTATEACSAALWVDGSVLARFERVEREHTQRLLPIVHELMADAGLAYSQLDGYVCGIGPGSFAGVRIAVALTQGMALAHGQPVVGVSSLAMLAQGAIRLHRANQVIAAIDARMSEVYFAVYCAGSDGLAVEQLPARLCPPTAAPVCDGESWAVGTGWGTYEAALRAATGAVLRGLDGAALPVAQDALTLALPSFQQGMAKDADGLTPIYLRNQVALTLIEQAALRAKNRR